MMTPGDLFVILEKIVRLAVIVWGGCLLGATLYLLFR